MRETGNCCNAGGLQSVYLSGFRIVLEEDKSRHCEYGVVLDGLRWVRFSQVKSLSTALPMSEDSKEAWEVVRQCKSPKGLRLETSYLARKCMAIEKFLCTLLETTSCSRADLGELLKVPTSRASRTRKTQRISRGRSGLRITMR